MFLLSNLWHGNITPSERAIQDGSEYQKLSHESTNYMDIFRSELSPSGKKALDDYSRTQMQLADIAEECLYSGRPYRSTVHSGRHQ